MIVKISIYCYHRLNHHRNNNHSREIKGPIHPFHCLILELMITINSRDYIFSCFFEYISEDGCVFSMEKRLNKTELTKSTVHKQPLFIISLHILLLINYDNSQGNLNQDHLPRHEIVSITLLPVVVGQ